MHYIDHTGTSALVVLINDIKPGQHMGVASPVFAVLKLSHRNAIPIITISAYRAVSRFYLMVTVKPTALNLAGYNKQP